MINKNCQITSRSKSHIHLHVLYSAVLTNMNAAWLIIPQIIYVPSSTQRTEDHFFIFVALGISLNFTNNMA